MAAGSCVNWLRLSRAAVSARAGRFFVNLRAGLQPGRRNCGRVARRPYRLRGFRAWLAPAREPAVDTRWSARPRPTGCRPKSARRRGLCSCSRSHSGGRRASRRKTTLQQSRAARGAGRASTLRESRFPAAFAAAYAVRCVRTSVSLARVASSRLAEDEFALLVLATCRPGCGGRAAAGRPSGGGTRGVLVSAVAEAAEPLSRSRSGAYPSRPLRCPSSHSMLTRLRGRGALVRLRQSQRPVERCHVALQFGQLTLRGSLHGSRGDRVERRLRLLQVLLRRCLIGLVEAERAWPPIPSGPHAPGSPAAVSSAGRSAGCGSRLGRRLGCGL